MMAAKPIPDGYHTATPYLVVRGADKTIEFLKKAFGAELSFEPMMRPDGKIMHADVKIGDSHVMISEATDQHPPMQSMIHLYVPNVDAVHQRALSAGGTSAMEPTDMFYGDRAGSVNDPSGNHWFIATHKEDVEMPELKKRAEAMFKQQKGKAA
jgi:PhnB protein